MSENPVCVAPTGDVCGEGAVWHAAHKAVYWTDINRFLIHRFTPADQCVRTWFFDEPVTALTLTDRDEVLTVVLGSRLILWEPATDMRHDHAFHLEGWPKVRLNDARSDPRGSLWVGSMRNNVKSDGSSGAAGGQDGVLFRLDPDAKITQWQRDIGISNTLAWSPDQRRFYFGDTDRKSTRLNSSHVEISYAVFCLKKKKKKKIKKKRNQTKIIIILLLVLYISN